MCNFLQTEADLLTDSALLHEMQTAGVFLDALSRFNDITGYLHPLEGFALMRLASMGEGVGEIVEIGSFMGRSTAWLATGSMRAGREKVHAIDHFRGSPEHQQGQKWEVREIVETGSTLPKFRENIERAGVASHVTPMVSSSLDAVATWNSPVRLLFIDGDHSYEASRADFEAWAPFVVPRGYIAFHDIGSWEGVTRFYGELAKTTQEYRQVVAVNSLRVVQRIAGQSVALRKSA